MKNLLSRILLISSLLLTPLASQQPQQTPPKPAQQQEYYEKTIEMTPTGFPKTIIKRYKDNSLLATYSYQYNPYTKTRKLIREGPTQLWIIIDKDATPKIDNVIVIDEEKGIYSYNLDDYKGKKIPVDVEEKGFKEAKNIIDFYKSIEPLVKLKQ